MRLNSANDITSRELFSYSKMSISVSGCVFIEVGWGGERVNHFLSQFVEFEIIELFDNDARSQS